MWNASKKMYLTVVLGLLNSCGFCTALWWDWDTVASGCTVPHCWADLTHCFRLQNHLKIFRSVRFKLTITGWIHHPSTQWGEHQCELCWFIPVVPVEIWITYSGYRAGDLQWWSRGKNQVLWFLMDLYDLLTWNYEN